MATVRYVSSSGVASYANSTVLATPMSLTTAFGNAAAGDEIRVMADGTYSRAASDTPTNAGTTASPILMIGADTGGNALTIARTSQGAINTAGMPVIAYAATFKLDDSTKINWQFIGLNITGAINGNLVDLAIATGSSQVVDCVVTNSGAGGSSAVGINLGTDQAAINCDVSVTCTTASAAIKTATVSKVIGGRLNCTNGAGILGGTNRLIAVGVVIYSSSYGIDITATAAAATVVDRCTIQGCTNDAIRIVSTAATALLVSSCMITDNGRAFDFLAGSGSQAHITNTRTRDNTSADVMPGGWAKYRAITTDTGGPETDYTNAGGLDFRLVAGSPGAGAGINGVDCGAIQTPAVAAGAGLSRVFTGQ